MYFNRQVPRPHVLILALVALVFPAALSALTVRSVELHGLQQLNEDYVRPYITVVPGGEYSREELEKAIEVSIARAEASPVINFLIIDEYENDDGTVDIVVEVLERSFNWLFFGGNAYVEAGRYNLLGPGSLMRLALGYNLQRLYMDVPFDGPAPLGIAGEVGHRLQNPYRPEKFLSRVTAGVMPYLDITPFLQLGVIGQYHQYRDWGKNETPHELSVGASVRGLYKYWQQLSPLALRFSARYRYVVWGQGSGTHILSGTARLDMRIINSIHITADGFVAAQTSEDTVELLHNEVPGDEENSGRRAWRATMTLPLRIYTGGETIPTDIGINPQFHIGYAGRQFATDKPTMAIGGGPYVDIGFPVGIRFSPEFYYQIKEKKIVFRFEVEFLSWN